MHGEVGAEVSLGVPGSAGLVTQDQARLLIGDGTESGTHGPTLDADGPVSQRRPFHLGTAALDRTLWSTRG